MSKESYKPITNPTEHRNRTLRSDWEKLPAPLKVIGKAAAGLAAVAVAIGVGAGVGKLTRESQKSDEIKTATYTVEDGDTLWGITGELYPDSEDRRGEMYDIAHHPENAGVFEDGLLEPGEVLVVPAPDNRE